MGSAVLPLAQAGATASSALALRTVPTRIYRGSFNPREAMDGWVFFLIVQSADAKPLEPLRLDIAYGSGGTIVREERMGRTALAAIARQDISPSRLTGQAPSPTVYWPQAFRIHVYVPSRLTIDEMRVDARLVAPGGVELSAQARLAILDYRQRTSLIFPFRGPAIISQAGVLGGGHRNRSGGFAIDALGLDPHYAPMKAVGSDRPQDYTGWGRPIIAPAAGRVVHSRNDRPDQPKDGESNPAFHAPEYPNGGDVGNHVVIDHGHGEHSLLAHLRSGSVRVRAGEQVSQGQAIGELGNSGDSSGPHLHYQLQNGPRWEYADGLPMRFDNVRDLSRGSYFEAR